MYFDNYIVRITQPTRLPLTRKIIFTWQENEECTVKHFGTDKLMLLDGMTISGPHCNVGNRNQSMSHGLPFVKLFRIFVLYTKSNKIKKKRKYSLHLMLYQELPSLQLADTVLLKYLY